LDDFRSDPALLSNEAIGDLSVDESRAILDVVPGSLVTAIERFSAAATRHEDGEHLEVLVALLWCQLRLIEHAWEHHRVFLSTVWPNDGQPMHRADD
jgi:crotonobetainyl-CoA:carnitine CoA-transferase CaiB-like acyl-CoA transferase